MTTQPIALVTIVDLLVIATTAYILTHYARTQRLIGLGNTRPNPMIIGGLSILGFYYALDLISIHVTNDIVANSSVTSFIQALHNHYAWFAMPVGIGIIAAGLHANSKMLLTLFEDLRRSESRFHDFADSSSDWFWEMGPDLRMTNFSERFLALLNEPMAQNRVGSTAAEILRDKDTYCSAEAADAHLATLAARRPFKNFMFSFSGRDNEVVHVRINGVPVYDSNGEFQGYRGTGTDITESKRAEIRLAESETLLRAIIDNTPSSINLKDSERRFVFVNKSFEAMHNLRAEDVVGRTVTDFFPDNFAQTYKDHDDVMLATRQSITREVPVPKANGSVHTVLATKFPVRGADGQLIGIGSIGTDITSLKERETELAEKSAQLQTILDTVPGRIAILDNGNRITFANARAASHYGKSVEELLGRTPEEILGDRYPSQYDEFIRKVRETGMTVSVPRYRSSLYPNMTQWVLGAPIVGNNGESLGVLTVGIDITEQQKAEDQLRQSQKMEVVGQLTGGVAHDFNNLLSIIICNLDVMQELLSEDDKLQVLIEEALTAAENGAKLNDRLLSFSRQQSLSPIVMNLNEDISNLLEMLKRTLGETIAVEARLQDDVWAIDVDPTLLETALLNLAINARDAMPGGGTLTINTANCVIDDTLTAQLTDLKPGEYVRLTLKDTGTGMSPDLLERAFEPFFTTKEVGHGTGLGLSMVFGFARQSGGHATLDSEPGKGTSVTLYLPRAQREMNRTPKMSKDIPMGRGETILLVEDEPKLRSLYADMLDGMGYNVLQAGDGLSALEVIRNASAIDLLLTDIVLPGGMSGPDIATEAIGNWPFIKLLYMSGYPRDVVERQSTLDDRITILKKPFQRVEIAHRLRDILDADTTPPPSATGQITEIMAEAAAMPRL